MSQPLPTGNFIWEDRNLWLNQDGTPNVNKIKNLEVDSCRGYLFEVDLGRHIFLTVFKVV